MKIRGYCDFDGLGDHIW